MPPLTYTGNWGTSVVIKCHPSHIPLTGEPVLLKMPLLTYTVNWGTSVVIKCHSSHIPLTGEPVLL
jgi:hypothetical protein